MTLTPYEWQNRFIKKYKGEGVVKAFAGTGKTYATILLLKDRNYKKIIVAVPTRKLKNQWIEELNKYKVKNVVVETFHILSKDRSAGLACDILVVDECHRSTSPVFSKIYDNIDYDHILGLSATPNRQCHDYCGDVIIDVPLKDANISDFTVFLHSIDLEGDEQRQYDEYSEGIRKMLGRMRSLGNEERWKFKEKLDSMIFRRRSLVYEAEQRIPKAIEILKRYEGKPTLIICKRIEQANILSKMTGHPVYHSEDTNEQALDDFQHDRIPVLLSVGMLAEGYDKRNIECLIIVSTAITEAYHIQSIGRAVRLPNDAAIHIILARRTTDEKLLQFRHMYNHEIVGNFSYHALKPRNPWVEQYYLSEEYSIDNEGRIFQKNEEGKQFFKDNPIIPALERIFHYRGGKFKITDGNIVLAKRGGNVISLGVLQEPLEPIKQKKIKPLKDLVKK